MFHDLVLAHSKLFFKFDANQPNLRIKIFKSSPDHGVGSDLVLKKKANPNSFDKMYQVHYEWKMNFLKDH